MVKTKAMERDVVSKKKVLLIVVDACTSRVLVPNVNDGTLPNLHKLAEAGVMKSNCVAIFPSLTPAATSSLITGSYPQDHNIFGFHWYDLENNEVVYYGDDFWVLVKLGLADFFDDLLNKLNHHRLTGNTLFEIVEKAGFKAACINFLIFRGNTQHKANVPLLLSLLPGVPTSQEVYGPSTMFFGDLVGSNSEKTGQSLKKIGGPFHRFGFDDENTANLLLQLAEDRALPDLSVAYFPDNDFYSHDVGPQRAVTTLEKLDKRLGELFSVYGGLEKMLSEVCILVTGDHSQSDMLADKEEAGIRLDLLLEDFKIAEIGKPWKDDDQLIICPDMRAAQIYFKNLSPKELEHVTAMLITDPRIDQLLWQGEALDKGRNEYHVVTLDRGRLRFWLGEEGPNSGIDQYGCPWSWEGDLDSVSGQLSDKNRLMFSQYPNAFERIVGSLNCHNGGHIWATAQPGYEFSVAETNVHFGGGSHGSLHSLDSVSPLLVAGAPEDLLIPDHPRSVDIAPLCLEMFGLASKYPVGASHINTAGK